MAIAPPLGLTCGASSGNAQFAKNGESLGRKSLVKFDHVHLVNRDCAFANTLRLAGPAPFP